MPNVNVEDRLYQDIKEYCRLNKLTISVFINDLLKKSFMVEKYDDAPPFFKKKEPETVRVERKSLEEFRDEILNDREPVKREPYIKPEVISVEAKKDEEALTEREKARRRIQYL